LCWQHAAGAGGRVALPRALRRTHPHRRLERRPTQAACGTQLPQGHRERRKRWHFLLDFMDLFRAEVDIFVLNLTRCEF
jgi:hypothetical protein